MSTATLDGADAFILSHETSIGQHPIDATINLAKGIAEAEAIFDFEQAHINNREDLKESGKYAKNIDVLTNTACSMAFEKDSDVDIILCFTETGKIARYLSKQRTKQPILACSTNSNTVRQANSFRGVVGYKIPQHVEHKNEEVLDLILKLLNDQGLSNLPYTKVMIFNGEHENDVLK